MWHQKNVYFEHRQSEANDQRVDRGFFFKGRIENRDSNPKISRAEINIFIEKTEYCRQKQPGQSCWMDGSEYAVNLEPTDSNGRQPGCLLKIGSIGGPDESYSFPILCGTFSNI